MPETLIKRFTDLLTIICLNWHVGCYGNHIYITIHLKVSTRKSDNRVAGWPFTLLKSHAVYWYTMSSAKEACMYLCMLVWLSIRARSFYLNFRTVRMGLHLYLLDVYLLEHSQINLAWNLLWTFTVVETGSGTELKCDALDYSLLYLHWLVNVPLCSLCWKCCSFLFLYHICLWQYLDCSLSDM
jgi:hypothetical protein